MESLTICCWKWKPKLGYHSIFEASTVNVLRSMVARHYRKPHRFVCITDDPSGIDPDIGIIPLWDDYKDLPGPHGVSCYRRLRAFSAEAAEIIGPRFVSLDLDCVITGDMDRIWGRADDFVIWGDTARNTPYNGSMFLLQAGTRRQVWDTFDPEKSPLKTRNLGLVGSDQAWIAACLGDKEAKWSAADGVYSWRVHLRKTMLGKLPLDARIVLFHGREDPWMPAVQAGYPWIAQHYR